MVFMCVLFHSNQLLLVPRNVLNWMCRNLCKSEKVRETQSEIGPFRLKQPDLPGTSLSVHNHSLWIAEPEAVMGFNLWFLLSSPSSMLPQSTPAALHIAPPPSRYITHFTSSLFPHCLIFFFSSCHQSPVITILPNGASFSTILCSR